MWWGGKNDLVPGQNGFAGYSDVKYAHKPAGPKVPAGQDWRGKPGGDNYYSFYASRRAKQEGDRYYVDSDLNNVLGAIDFVTKADKDSPFCIYLPLSFPHPAYTVEDPFFSMIDRSKLPPRIPAPTDWKGKPSMLKGIHERQNLKGWTEDRWTELRATYYGMCARSDSLLEMLVKALRDAGLYDDTAIFFFSDHGDFAGDYGIVEKNQNTFEDCLSRVPFVIKPPAWIDVKPRVSDALVELIDFPATVEAMTGISPGHTHFGRSLLPIIAGKTDEHRDAVFCEGGRLHGEKQCMELESTSSQEPAGLYWPQGQPPEQRGPRAHESRHVPHAQLQIRPPPLRDRRALRPSRGPFRTPQPHRRPQARRHPRRPQGTPADLLPGNLRRRPLRHRQTLAA